LQAAELSAVAAPESKADQIIIVVDSADSTLEMGFVVRRFWEPPQAFAVDAASGVAELEKLPAAV